MRGSPLYTLEPLRSAARRAGLAVLGPTLARTIARLARRHFFYVDNFQTRRKASAGGDEAALFVNDLIKLYTKYAESQGVKDEQVPNTSSRDIGSLHAIQVLE